MGGNTRPHYKWATWMARIAAIELINIIIGIPLQFSTDCGSETTQLFGLANALRSTFHDDISLEDLPAHVYLRSVHNISIERSWLRLRLDWGDNAVLKFNEGVDAGLYNPSNPNQYMLCQWLWPKLLRRTLNEFMDYRNGVRMRKDKKKPGPSGMSRNEAFSLPESWGGRNCLLPVNLDIVQRLKQELGGDDLLEFVPNDFSEQASRAYDTLGVQELNLENICLSNKMFCPQCKHDFPRLDPDSPNKPQCGACGVIGNNITIPICNGCLNIYKNESDIPAAVIRLPGAYQLLFGDQRAASDEPEIVEKSLTSILKSASRYQAQASDRRTGNSVKSLASRPGLSKALEIRQEWAEKRREHTANEKKIKIAAKFWESGAAGSKMNEIHDIRVSSAFCPTALVKESLDKILEFAKTEFESKFPQASELNWTNVNLMAHESNTRWSSLRGYKKNGTVNDLYKHFLDEGLGSKTSLNNRLIELRLVYDKETIVLFCLS
ncbi:hypothetical protein BD779DRAFT_1741354 [Infundibulicybe gibba]|nr:hypothetical protein BD779DRAFT_1741354 [Infundibulicybe gibba]